MSPRSRSRDAFGPAVRWRLWEVPASITTWDTSGASLDAPESLRWLDVGSPNVIDGMTVRTGDVVHADVNGALVIPPELADQVYEKALQVREREGKMFERYRAPDFTIDKWLAS